MEPDETHNLLTGGEVAEMCGVSYETVRKWMVSGALPFIESGPNFVRRVYRRDAERMKRQGQPPVDEADKAHAI